VPACTLIKIQVRNVEEIRLDFICVSRLGFLLRIARRRPISSTLPILLDRDWERDQNCFLGALRRILQWIPLFICYCLSLDLSDRISLVFWIIYTAIVWPIPLCYHCYCSYLIGQTDLFSQCCFAVKLSELEYSYTVCYNY